MSLLSDVEQKTESIAGVLLPVDLDRRAVGTASEEEICSAGTGGVFGVVTACPAGLRENAGRATLWRASRRRRGTGGLAGSAGNEKARRSRALDDDESDVGTMGAKAGRGLVLPRSFDRVDEVLAGDGIKD